MEMVRINPSDGSQDRLVTNHSPRESGQELPKDEDKNHMNPVLQQGLKNRLDVPTTSSNGAPWMAAYAKSRLRGTSSRVAKLNTRLIESIPSGDTALMSSIMAKGAKPNATCRLEYVSACHIAAMHDNDALDLLLSSKADSYRCDRHGRTPLHLAAWTGNVKHIALLLNFPEALRKRVVDHVLSPETIKEVRRYRPVNKLTNVPCRRNVESTLLPEWSDGVEHNCKNLKEILPVFQEGWTALHAASARAHHHCVQLLLAAGADMSAQDHLHRTPLDVAGCAYYSGHKIDVNNFVETVDVLLKAGGKLLKCSDQSNPLATPLHTAVELESEAAVKQLLQGEACTTAWNSRGLTAMHVCVEKKNKKLLQLLADHMGNTKDPSLVTVDVKGHTFSDVLCAAVEAEWIQGVSIALNAGASIATQANGESPMDIAARLGNLVLLQKMLDIAQDRKINYSSEERANALFKAISHNHQDALEFLLKNGFSIETVNSDKVNVFHIATKHDRKEILEYLLAYDSNIREELINMCDPVGPPLYYAVENNHDDCAALLISKGAKVNVKCEKHREKPTTLLHIAARKNHCKIATMIIDKDSKTVHVTSYELGWTPLHEACHSGNREMIKLLLSKGADLSGDTDTYTDTPIKLLMKYVSKPTELLQEIFDSCIRVSEQDESYQNSSTVDVKCTITVDYTVLNPSYEAEDSAKDVAEDVQVKAKDVPEEVQVKVEDVAEDSQVKADDVQVKVEDVAEDIQVKADDVQVKAQDVAEDVQVKRKQMRVIQALLDTGNTHNQEKLLLHPLVESFVIRQWRSISPFFYVTLALHVCFVLSVNLYAFCLFKYKDRKNEPMSNISPKFWVFLIYFSTILILMQDFIFIKRNGMRNHLLCWETWLRFLSTPLALSLPLIVSCNSESQAESVRLFSVTTLLFTWIKIMLLLSRFPKIGYYVLMYEKVARRVIIILVPLSLLIFGFSISFMIQFHAQPPFEGFWSSLLMTMVMMSSEPGYKDTFNKKQESASLIMLRLTFAAFLFLVTIVLMNLLVGVAVNDVKDLEDLGHRKKLEKKVEFITAFESTAWRSFFKKNLPASLFEKWFEDMNLLVGEIGPRSNDKHMRRNWYKLPARIREAIFEKAQLQKKQLDEMQDLMQYNVKFNEIHKVIVKTDNSKATTNQRLTTLETAVYKIFEEICKSHKENADKSNNQNYAGTHTL